MGKWAVRNTTSTRTAVTLPVSCVCWHMRYNSLEGSPLFTVPGHTGVAKWAPLRTALPEVSNFHTFNYM